MTEQELKEQILAAVLKAKESNPLTPSITNTVTINFVANAQLAVGGSAAMIYLPDEAETLASIGGSFYINMGTLLPVYAETLPRVIRVLKNCNKPWVLDPVGIGAGALRRSLLLSMKECPPSVIRGNASEIIALAITTCLYVLHICLADKTGNTINEVINNVPITFIPITTVNAHRIEIIILYISVLTPLDLEKSSSNVILNILL